MIISREEVLHVGFEFIVKDGLADIVDGLYDEVLIVNAGEGFAGDFIGLEEVMEVGGREVLATIAFTAFVDWLKIFSKSGVFDVDAAVFGINCAVAGLSGWTNAVEGVAAIECAVEEVARFAAHAEKVARLVLWQDFVSELNDIWCFVFGSIERADTVAIYG